MLIRFPLGRWFGRASGDSEVDPTDPVDIIRIGSIYGEAAAAGDTLGQAAQSAATLGQAAESASTTGAIGLEP